MTFMHSWNQASRWVLRRKWTVTIILFVLILVLFPPFRLIFYHPSLVSWFNKSAQLTSPVTIKQRQTLQEKALQHTSTLPPPAFHPWCPTPIDTKLRYTNFYSYTSKSIIYLAVRIQKAETYISTFIHELTTLILYVGSHRFYVHVVFADNTPPSLVKSLEYTLDQLRVAYKITLEQPQVMSQGYVNTQITQKNLAMQPFYNGDALKQLNNNATFDYITFIEDAVFCAGDVLELLYEHKFQGSELTCALEWRGGLLYDKWTIRTLTGKPPYMKSELSKFFTRSADDGVVLPQPFFTDPTTRKRYRFLRSFPVFSCWSSIVIMDPRIFLPVVHENEGKAGLRFRAADEKDPDRYSDTFVLCVDMWERNMYKVIMVPHASIGDTFEMYDLVRQDGRRQLKHPAGLEPEGRGLISYFRWTSSPPEEMVHHDYGLWDKNERVGRWNDSLGT